MLELRNITKTLGRISVIKLFLPICLLCFGQLAYGQLKPCKIPEFNNCIGIKTLTLKSVRGSVIDESGVVVPNSCVTIFDWKLRPVASAATDDLGRFRLRNVKDARYHLVVGQNGFTPVSQDIIVNSTKGRSRGLAVSLVILGTDSCSYAK